MPAKKATFGAGCFWGTQKFFDKEFGSGLLDSVVGYAGGKSMSASYREVCTGTTGHAEVLHLTYDSDKVNYADLCRFFFRMHDPTTPNRQGNDRGTQYRSVIFYHDQDQREIAEQVKKDVASKFSNPICTEITEFSTFVTAEDYHQKYLEANPTGYCNHKLYW